VGLRRQQALADTHIFIPEIARRADLRSRRVVSWLRSEGVRPSLALQENRDFGYPRRAVEPLLTDLIDKTARMKAGRNWRRRPRQADRGRPAGAGTKATAETMGVRYRRCCRKSAASC
jgi:hypothetical protein